MIYPVVDCANIFFAVVILITFDLGDKPSVYFGAFFSPISLALNGFRISDMLNSESATKNSLTTLAEFYTSLQSGDVLAWSYLAVFWIAAVFMQQWLFIIRDDPRYITRDQKYRKAIRRGTSSQIYTSCSE